MNRAHQQDVRSAPPDQLVPLLPRCLSLARVAITQVLEQQFVRDARQETPAQIALKHHRAVRSGTAHLEAQQQLHVP
jgi:hypothetical protein